MSVWCNLKRLINLKIFSIEGHSPPHTHYQMNFACPERYNYRLMRSLIGVGKGLV